ncbi:MAG: hypothetical protein KF879_12560 [Saprospiraceae bacterium]|nr:hypothetical protein [Saprospiraceae bacterium]
MRCSIALDAPYHPYGVHQHRCDDMLVGISTSSIASCMAIDIVRIVVERSGMHGWKTA